MKTEEKIEFEVEDQIVLLTEMLDDMKKSIETSKVVQTQSKLMNEILENYQKEHDDNTFEEFIKENEKQIRQITDQINKLNARIDCINECVKLAKEDDVAKKAVNCLLTGLGVFANK